MNAPNAATWAALKHRAWRLWAWLVEPVDPAQGLAWLTRRRLGLIAVLTSALLACAVWVVCSQWQARLQTQKRLSVLSAEALTPAAVAVAPPPPQDFTATMPPYPDVAAVVSELQRAGAAHQVVIQDIQVQHTPATEQQLAQAELSVQLRGSYSSTKNVLREVLARYPFTTVRRLAMRRTPPTQDLQTDGVLVLWARPLLPAAQQTETSSEGARP